MSLKQENTNASVELNAWFISKIS